jgi:hypothetical protein
VTGAVIELRAMVPRRVAQKIRGNHSLRKQIAHQRASYWAE